MIKSHPDSFLFPPDPVEPTRCDCFVNSNGPIKPLDGHIVGNLHLAQQGKEWYRKMWETLRDHIRAGSALLKNCTVSLHIDYQPLKHHHMNHMSLKPWPIFSPQLSCKTWVRYFKKASYISYQKHMSHLTFKWEVVGFAVCCFDLKAVAARFCTCKAFQICSLLLSSNTKPLPNHQKHVETVSIFFANRMEFQFAFGKFP